MGASARLRWRVLQLTLANHKQKKRTHGVKKNCLAWKIALNELLFITNVEIICQNSGLYSGKSIKKFKEKKNIKNYFE